MRIDSLLCQLANVYYNEEYWHKTKLDRSELDKYHQRLLDDGNIITVMIDGQLLGYMEFWRITFEQFGRLICKDPFSAYEEDVTTGNICYVANVWVKRELRQSTVFRRIRDEFFVRNGHCEYYVGEALRKRTQPIKVFKVEELKSKLFKSGRK